MFYRVSMATRGRVSAFIFLCALVVAVQGFELQAKLAASIPLPEDCTNPPLKRFGHECCRLPKERIWGDLRGSLKMCLRKLKQDLKQESQLMRQEVGDGEPETATSEMGTSAGDPSESSSPLSTTPRLLNLPRRPQWKKPHHLQRLQRHSNDSCFMECVFEDQGFLTNKMLNKEALLTRLQLTLGRNEPWLKAAAAAVEKCYMGLQTPSGGACQSGSEEIFRCIFKELFFNCPNWLQNDYCASLKEFYQKCPNGPPPEATETHTTALPEEPEDMEGAVTSQSERYSQEQ